MRPISLLLVDDNPRFLRLLTRFLHARYQDEVVVVGTAGGGMEGLTLAAELHPQVVLLDLAMPDMPGWEVIPRLRVAYPDLGIVVVTLLDPIGYREMSLKAGADEFVSKSALGTDLLPAIRRASQRDRPQRDSTNVEPILSEAQVGNEPALGGTVSPPAGEPSPDLAARSASPNGACRPEPKEAH